MKKISMDVRCAHCGELTEVVLTEKTLRSMLSALEKNSYSKEARELDALKSLIDIFGIN